MQKITDEINVEKGFSIIKNCNIQAESFQFSTQRKALHIQFHFNMDGDIYFNIIKGTHRIEIAPNESLFFFNPKNLVPIDAVMTKDSKMLSLLFSLDYLHHIFDDFSIDFNFFKPQNSYKKLYAKRPISPTEIVIINQIYDRPVSDKIDLIYLKAKAMELLTYYFSEDSKKPKKPGKWTDKRSIEKIKKAKQLLIKDINEPPSVEQLADEVLLPVNVLKKGFKELYGEPVYKYILNYKLELARQLLLSKQYSIKEISYQMGYSAPTHFVVAFKNKFGVTPKRYIK